MTIEVRFRTAQGEETRRLPSGVGVSVYGKITGLLNVPASFSAVVLDIPEISLHKIGRTNVFGDYSFWFETPREARKLTVRVSILTLTGRETAVIPVSIGGITPDEVPESLEVGSDAGFFASAGTVVGFGMLALLAYLLFKNKALT